MASLDQQTRQSVLSPYPDTTMAQNQKNRTDLLKSVETCLLAVLLVLTLGAAFYQMGLGVIGLFIGIGTKEANNSVGLKGHKETHAQAPAGMRKQPELCRSIYRLGAQLERHGYLSLCATVMQK